MYYRIKKMKKQIVWLSAGERKKRGFRPACAHCAWPTRVVFLLPVSPTLRSCLSLPPPEAECTAQGKAYQKPHNNVESSYARPGLLPRDPSEVLTGADSPSEHREIGVSAEDCTVLEPIFLRVVLTGDPGSTQGHRADLHDPVSSLQPKDKG